MSPDRQFRDRAEAGERLAGALRDRGVAVDLVLAVPRGGLPVGRAVADEFDAPLDVIVAKKVGAPGNPELAIGAVASDGSVWRNEMAFDTRGIGDDYFEREAERVGREARLTAARYRGDRPAPALEGKRIAVVDDGVATGATMTASLQGLQDSGAERVLVAIPVGPPSTVRELRGLTHEVVCLLTPANFLGVGGFYERFEQVSDEAAMAYLEAG